MATKKKSDVDSTGYHNERVKKAMGLYDKAKSEKLGTEYEGKFSKHLDNTVKDKMSYEKRKLGTPGPSTAKLKKGGSVKPCAKCGKSIKKK